MAAAALLFCVAAATATRRLFSPSIPPTNTTIATTANTAELMVTAGGALVSVAFVDTPSPRTLPEFAASTVAAVAIANPASRAYVVARR